MTCQDVPLEGGGDAGGVVVGGDQPGRVLDQVDSEQQPSPGWSRAARVARKRARSLDGEVADGAAQEGDQAALGVGQAVQVHAEVADHAGDLDRPGRPRPGWPRRRAGSARPRRRPRSGAGCPASRRASMRATVLSEVPEPSSIRVEAPQRAAISGRVGRQDLALGPGRVVLGQLGDLLEEGAAPRVVQPPGRDPLGVDGQARRGRRRPGQRPRRRR